MRAIKKGATSQSVYLVALDSTSTTGGRKTGLLFNTAGLTAYYVRNQGSATAITLATLAAANSAYSAGGFKEVDATNMPGVYRLDVPDAAFASGADSVVVTVKGATGMVQADVEVQLTGVDLQDATAMGVSRIDAAISSRMATFTLPTNFSALAITAGGAVTVGTNNDKTGYSLTQAFPANFSALSITAAGRVDVAAVSGTAQTARDLGANLDVAVSTRLASASYTAPLDAAGTRSAVGLASANLDTQLGTIAGYIDTEIGTLQTTATAIKAKTDNLPAAPAATGDAMALTAAAVDAVWDEATAGHAGAGTTGKALTDAGSAGDPWGTSIPGAYSAGTAGYILGTNLDAVLSAVKAKTDNLPASPAAVGSAMTLTAAYDFAKGTVAVTESYAANGVAPTPVQALLGIHQMLMQFAIGGTSYTVKKLDNTTTAFVVTLDDATNPTGAART